MAKIVLGMGTPHAPQLRIHADQWPLLMEKDQRDPRMSYETLLQRARPGLDREITPEKMGQRYDACQRALGTLSEVLADASPDVMVVVGDDQHEQFLDDNMPMFCVYRGAAMSTGRREGVVGDDQLRRAWGDAPWRRAEEESDPRTPREYSGAPALADHLIRYLVDEGFDLACSTQLRPGVGIGHAFGFIYRKIDRGGAIPMLPLMVNTFFPPNQPSPRRCYALGLALRRAIDAWESDQRVAIIASGGLSHVIIDEEVDRMTIEGMVEKDAEQLCSLPVDRLNLGTSEIRNWVVVAGAMEPTDITLLDYLPCYRSPAGTGCGMGFAYWR